MGEVIYETATYSSIESGVDDNSYGTALGYNSIRINPNMDKYTGNATVREQILKYCPVVGLMMNDFTYSIASEWEPMQYPQILDMGVFNDLTAFSGGGEIGAVFRSKKFWKKSGDLTINPEMRIIDVEGTGAPIKIANTLMWFAVGSGIMNIAPEATVDSIKDGASEGLKTVIRATKFGAQALDKSGTLANIVDVMGNGAIRAMEDIDDYNKLRSCPPTLDVQIGRVFRHNDMVLTNLSFTFSKEVSSAGPLYVDISMTLVTRKIISTINETGLNTEIASSVGYNRTQYDIEIDDVSANTLRGDTRFAAVGEPTT